MILLEELRYNFLYKKKFHLPINEKDKKNNSLIYLLGKDITSSINVLRDNPLMINNKYFESYYIEKNLLYYINEGYIDLDQDIINEAEQQTVLSTPKLAEPKLSGNEVHTNDHIGSSSSTRAIKMRMKKSSYEVKKLGNTDKNTVGTDKSTSFDNNNDIEKPETVNEEFIGYLDYGLDYMSEDTHIRFKTNDNKDLLFLFDQDLVLENNQYNPIIKKILYNERFRNNKEVLDIYKHVEEELKFIKYTHLDLAKYNNKNLFIDVSNTNKAFLDNFKHSKLKGTEIYLNFINRLIQDPRPMDLGYSRKTIIVPIRDFYKKDIDYLDFNQDINLLSCILRLLKVEYTKLQIFKDLDFILLTDNGYIKIDFSKLLPKDYPLFLKNINSLLDNSFIEDDDRNKETTKSIVTNIVNKIEDNKNIKVYNLTGEDKDITKQDLIEKIEKAAEKSSDTEEALDRLEDDDSIKQILDYLASEEDNNVKINAARASRMIQLNNQFMDKQIKGQSIRDLINPPEINELPETKLVLDTINDEWSHLQYTNFETVYNISEDIAMILNSFSEKNVPLAIRDLKVEDTSTSEDSKETYTVNFEDANGERFTIKFDVPRLDDGSFMKLRGNDKTINGQLTLIPIVKTDEDTVQIISNYKKIFITRYGTSTGKAYPISDKLIKALKETDKIKVVLGNNNRICSKYELPIDYIDLATLYNTIETKTYIFNFNQDDLRKLYDVDEKKGIPIGYNKKTKEVVYYSIYTTPLSSEIVRLLIEDEPSFSENYNNAKLASKYTYSKASILNTTIPVIVIMAYHEGLIKAMEKGNIEYNIVEKRVKATEYQDVIKFNDAYLVYTVDYNSSLLMNGLKECNTEDYSIKDMNNRAMYLEFLELFGNRIIADGLDNFYDLMIDPITKEVLEYYKLPTDYVTILAYANALLADNKYVKHTDMSGRRYRSNELVAGYIYQALAESYGDYRTKSKRTKRATMTIKQTIVLDKIFEDPTCSDLSTLNELLNLESANTVGYKGLVGMNSDRSYSLDKRTYHNSMLNILGLSTGFAGNVGVTRQTTVDMNIEGKRGYIKTINGNANEFNTAKTFTITEALTPYGTTRDDPFRSAMTFIQTSKHAMRIKKGHPLLVSNGAEQALPYLTSNTFAFNAKEDGKIIELTDKYMIVQYKDGNSDYVNLDSVVKKNSNGGFHLVVKLDTDLKAGKNFKKNDILAYDKLSYSNTVGLTDNLSYNLGNLCKIAILNTDEGFEDSCIIDEYLSDAMASEVVIQKDITLPKNTNVYHMVKKGQAIQEGESLITFQNAFDEDDINILLKNLVDDEDAISDLGRIPIKSKVTGNIEDIKIYRTTELEEMSDSLRKVVKDYEKPINELKKTMSKYDIASASQLPATYKLESTGKLKHVMDGVLIEFYLKYEDKMSIGDKLVFYSALKGVVKEIFPEGQEPYTDFRPNENINAFLSQGSVLGRMVASIFINGGINKGLIELDRSVKALAGIEFKNITEM